MLTILDSVIEAMQDAEEIGGPEGKEYIALMNAIIAEATKRRDIYSRTLSKPKLMEDCPTYMLGDREY